jgi:hypothetical protein
MPLSGEVLLCVYGSMVAGCVLVVVLFCCACVCVLGVEPASLCVRGRLLLLVCRFFVCCVLFFVYE